jgi:hypothetical protein
MTGMSVTLLYIDGCPNRQAAEERLLTALQATSRLDDELTRELVSTPEEAERLRFRGSPTILVDGEDPFADPSAPVGLACRLFETPDGLRGAPTVDQLVQVLR